MCTVWLLHSKWLSEQSNESASDFALSLNILLWNLFRWFRRLRNCSDGQLVIGSFITIMCLLMHHVSCRVFWQNIKSPKWFSLPYSPGLAPCDFWLFSKLKEKRCQTIDEIQENTMGQLMAIGRSQGAYFEGDWGVTVLCTLYLVSFSVNVSTFHITWLDTFWTGLVYFRGSEPVALTCATLAHRLFWAANRASGRTFHLPLHCLKEFRQRTCSREGAIIIDDYFIMNHLW